MTKLFKITAISLSLIVFVAIIIIASLMIFVSPNRFKPLIIEEVKKSTGRDLVMDGNLSWTFFPYLGVKTGHVVLNNTKDFTQKTFAEVQGVTITVKLLPLLHSRIESTGMTLDGLKLFLIKNAKGQTNWKDLQAAPAVLVSSNQPMVASSSPAQKTSLGLAISAVTISDASISWINESAKQYFDINHFNLKIKNVSLDQPVPLSVSFEFSGKNPTISGKMDLTGSLVLEMDQSNYRFDKMILNTHIEQNGKKWDVAVKGNVIANTLDETIQLKQLTASIANLTLTGDAIVKSFTQPRIMSHVIVQPFDVKKWLSETNQDVDALEVMKNLSGEFDIALSKTAPLHVTGDVKIDEIQASKVKMSHLAVKTELNNGILNLMPMTADFYQGTINGQAKVNLTTSVPQMTVQAKLMNVQAEPLLTDLASNQKFKLIGAGNVDINVTTTGLNGDTLVKNLNGTAQLRFNNGTLQGIDIPYWLDTANNLIHRETPSTENTEKTAFGTLTATANIQNGVVSNQDLYLDSPKFDTKGNGTIDLVNKQIHYQLQTVAKQTAENQKNNIANLYHVTIPILIKGSLKNPSVRLDTEVLLKTTVKEKAKEKIQEEIQKHIPDKAKELLNGLFGQ